MKKILKLIGLLAVVVVVCFSGFIACCFFKFASLLNETHPMHPELASLPLPTAAPDIALGQRIYAIRNGCIDCHGADLSGAVVMHNGAMGSIYGTNITTHKTRNLKDEDIIRAVRYGVHPSGRSLRFMSSFDYEGLSRDDLASLIAYLRSVPEIKKDDPPSSYGPVAKVLSALGQMPVMFPAKFIDHSKGFAEKPPEGSTVEFGKYLANSCIGCHGQTYKGGPIAGGDPNWPEAGNIRMGSTGSSWSHDSFFRMMRTGISPTTHHKLRPPMPVAALQQMNEMELEALWKFLSSLQ